MRKSIRVLAGILCAFMVAGAPLLAQGGPAAPAKSADAVKLNVWYALSGDSGEAFKAMLDKFNAANADIALTYSYSGSYADTATKVSAALVSNTAPDLALMAAGPLYTGGRGDFYMESKIGGADFDKADFFPGVWEYAKFQGKICAIPYGISTPILYYNKAILDKAGIDIEKNPPKTWDDLYKLAKLAQSKGNAAASTDFWGFDTTDSVWLFKTMLNQNGNGIISVQGTTVSPAFADDKAVQVATWWEKMADEKIMPVGQHSNAEKKFLSGNIAFLVATSARIAKWSTNASIPASAAPMPYWQKPSVALGGNVLIILTQAPKVREAAWRLVKYLTTSENQTDFALKTGYLPIRKSGLALPAAQAAIKQNQMYSIAFKQIDISWSYWHFEQMGTMDSLIWTALDEIERNAQSPKDALNKAAKDLQAEMD